MNNVMQYFKMGLLSVTVLVVSCTDLGETVYSEVTDDKFTPTSDDIISLIAPVYTPLRFGVMGFHAYLSAQTESADVVVTPVRPNGWYDGGRFHRMHQHTWTATDATPNSIWNMCFDGINAANRMLLQIEDGSIPAEAIEENREALVAELKVARAFYYAILLDTHGNVPIVTDFGAEELPEQSTRQEVYDFVVQELTTNIPQLSETADQSTYGRFNKWAGKAVLAEVYLNAEVYTGTARWDKVIEVTNEIITAAETNGLYALEEDYTANFTRDNFTSSEIIFAVPYDEVNGTGNQYHMSTIRPVQQAPLGMQTQPWGGASSQPQFIDTYDEDDTRLEDTWIIGPQFNDQGEEIINFRKNVPSIQETEFSDGYPIGKYEVYEGIPVDSDVDFPFYRYAEVLMMKAEALLRTSPPDPAQAAALVTDVRMRAFEDPADATVTGAELQQGSSYIFGWWEPDGTITNPDPGTDIQYGRMLDELGWEFAAEGHRRTDLIRFGVFTTKTWLNHEPNGDTRSLFPIPQDALNTNTNLDQNPGY